VTISMYRASAPLLVLSLSNLKAILEKAAAHAEAKKIDPLVLVASRLYPDMFPLTRQVQIATDVAKGGMARLAGVDAPKYEDTEVNPAELIARLDKTIDYINGFKPAQIDGSEDKDIVLAFPSGTLKFKGAAYLQNYVFPNVYFHVTTAYNILRHNGVEIGKKDFLGPIQ
jgi:hypothetical protein